MGDKKGNGFSYFLKRRSTVSMIIVGLAVVIAEVIEHIYLGESLFESHFLIEGFIYGVGIPLFGITLLALLDRTVVERDRAKTDLELHRAISQAINQAQNRQELLERIVRVPGEVLPVVSCFLHLVNENLQPASASDGNIISDGFNLHLATAWAPAGKPEPGLEPPVSQGACRKCLEAVPTRSELQPCGLPPELLPVDRARYLLPLFCGGSLVGVLHVDLPQDTLVTSHLERRRVWQRQLYHQLWSLHDLPVLPAS